MSDRIVTFIEGKPWRRKAEPDTDEWVCPVYALLDGEERFVLDVKVSRDECSPDNPVASKVAFFKAMAVAYAFDLANKDKPVHWLEAIIVDAEKIAQKLN